MPRVYCGGSFDILHPGHLYYLRQARKLAGNEHVIVALNTDEFIEEFKGKKPIMAYEERFECLRGCKYVDNVICNIGGKDSKPAILMAKPDIIIAGGDWKDKDYYNQMSFTQDWLDDNYIRLLFADRDPNGISSTKIKERILNS